MIVDVVSRRYAQALYEAAGDLPTAERQLAQLDAIAEALSESPALRRVIEHPLVAPAAKVRVVVRLLGDDTRPEVRRFLEIAFERGRGGGVAMVAEALRERVDNAMGRHRALVRSVASLGEDQLEAVRDALARRLGGSVEIETEIDESLIGGLEIRVGGQILDLSVARRLRDMRRSLLAGAEQAGAAGPGAG